MQAILMGRSVSWRPCENASNVTPADETAFEISASPYLASAVVGNQADGATLSLIFALPKSRTRAHKTAVWLSAEVACNTPAHGLNVVARYDGPPVEFGHGRENDGFDHAGHMFLLPLSGQFEEHPDDCYDYRANLTLRVQHGPIKSISTHSARADPTQACMLADDDTSKFAWTNVRPEFPVGYNATSFGALMRSPARTLQTLDLAICYGPLYQFGPQNANVPFTFEFLVELVEYHSHIGVSHFVFYFDFEETRAWIDAFVQLYRQRGP